MRGAAIEKTVSLLLLVSALFGCSGEDRKVILSDETGSRTLVYEYGKGFIPQARVPEDPFLYIPCNWPYPMH